MNAEILATTASSLVQILQRCGLQSLREIQPNYITGLALFFPVPPSEVQVTLVPYNLILEVLRSESEMRTDSLVTLFQV